MNQEKKFYENIILTWFLLFVYPPLGILLLWKVGHFDLLTRSFVSLFFGLLFLELHHLYSSFIRALILSMIIIFLFYRYHKLQAYEKKGKNLLEYALNHLEIRNIINNYLTKYAPPTKNFNDLLSFEIYLRKKYPIIYQHLNLTHLEDTFINIIYHQSPYLRVYETINQNEEKNQQYEKELNQINRLIAPILKLEGDKLSLYFTFTLIKQLSVEYYGNLFQKKYGSEFKNSDLKNIDEAIYQYSLLPSLNTEKNSLDLAMFTYYLMHHNAFASQDFYQNLDYLYQQLQIQTKIHQEKLFQKYLFTSKDELLKEIETMEIIKEMKTKARFEIFVLDLLKKLNYENIQKPINKYLDYIIFLNDHQFGVNIVFQDDETKLNPKHLNHLVAGLKYNQIDKGIIITNTTYTDETKNLADQQNIIIWDQEILRQKALTVKRYQNMREEPTHEIKFSDLSYIPFEKITLKEIDIMTKSEFKYYIAELFKRNDYYIKKINSTNEGLDLIIEKNSLTFGVYTKNELIIEDDIKMFITTCAINKIDKMIVLTNKELTKEALILAKSCKIMVLTRHDLLEKIKKALGAFSQMFFQSSIS